MSAVRGHLPGSLQPWLRLGGPVSITLALAIIILPVVLRSTEDMLRLVPPTLRQTLARFVRAEADKWGEVIRKGNIRAE